MKNKLHFIRNWKSIHSGYFGIIICYCPIWHAPWSFSTLTIAGCCCCRHRHRCRRCCWSFCVFLRLSIHKYMCVCVVVSFVCDGCVACDFFFHFSFFFNWIDLGAFYIDPNESGSNGVWHVTILAKMYDGEPHLVVGYGCAAARKLWMPKGGFGSMQQLSISICQAVPGRISISTRPKTPTIGSVETDQLEISRSDWIIDSADESYLASVVLSWFLILINTHTPQCCIKLERLHCICLRGSNWAVLIRVYCETKLEKKIFNNKQNNIGWYIVICPFSHNIWKECRKQSPSAHAVIHFW